MQESDGCSARKAPNKDNKEKKKTGWWTSRHAYEWTETSKKKKEKHI